MSPKISIKNLIRRFWKKTVLTWILVIFEGVCLLLMPLVIGWAVDGLMAGSLRGTIQLVLLCLILLMVGASRRFYDTRAYSSIYRIVSSELVHHEIRRRTSVSKISARTNLFTEFIEFFENSMPDIINQFIALGGTLCIIAVINVNIFGVCLIGALCTGIIYFIGSRKMMRLNKGQNDVLEQQVDAITTKNNKTIKSYFSELMSWNIRLSDLETLNYSLTWIAQAGVLLFSIIIVSKSGVLSFGQVIATIMYVFGFMESVMTFPLYYQQLVRLQEITLRLSPNQNG